MQIIFILKQTIRDKRILLTPPVSRTTTSNPKHQTTERWFPIGRESFVGVSLTFLPTYTGMPMTMAGTAMPAMRAMPTGAPTSVPSCQRIFFFLLHGFLPQNVQPDGLGSERGGRREGARGLSNFGFAKRACDTSIAVLLSPVVYRRGIVSTTPIEYQSIVF